MTATGARRQPLVCTGEANPTRTARDNPVIIIVVHFENAHKQGGYNVGYTTAYHEPCQGCSLHDHRGMDETFVVREGAGIIQVGNVIHEVNPGFSILVPAGIKHRLQAADASRFDNPYHPGYFVVDCFTVVARGHEDDPTPWLSTDA